MENQSVYVFLVDLNLFSLSDLNSSKVNEIISSYFNSLFLYINSLLLSSSSTKIVIYVCNSYNFRLIFPNPNITLDTVSLNELNFKEFIEKSKIILNIIDFINTANTSTINKGSIISATLSSILLYLNKNFKKNELVYNNFILKIFKISVNDDEGYRFNNYMNCIYTILNNFRNDNNFVNIHFFSVPVIKEVQKSKNQNFLHDKFIKYGLQKLVNNDTNKDSFVENTKYIYCTDGLEYLYTYLILSDSLYNTNEISTISGSNINNEVKLSCSCHNDNQPLQVGYLCPVCLFLYCCDSFPIYECKGCKTRFQNPFNDII